MKTEIKIIDNFLDNFQFKNLKDFFFGKDINWFFNDFITIKNDGEFQFTHYFYDNFSVNSDYFNFILPILNKLQCKSLIRIKANLTTKSNQIKNFKLHTDYNFNCNTAIFYLNTNNGKTIFENKKEIKSIENRMIIFPSKLKHTGTTHTDEKIRIVLNINYF